MKTSSSVTEILFRVSEGDRRALEELLPVVYEELRRLARARMRYEKDGHTLRPTALTHEAYLRLVGQAQLKWDCRAHFMAAASQAMRRVLVEHARSRGRLKRGGGLKRVPLDDPPAVDRADRLDLVALDEALEHLASFDPRKARVVELLFFGGVTAAEAARILAVTPRTVERDWRFSRLWLLREMERGAARTVVNGTPGVGAANAARRTLEIRDTGETA